MPRKKNVLAGLEELLEAQAEEIKELRAEIKRLKARMDKIFPVRRGRPPMLLSAILQGDYKTLTKAGEKKKSKPGRKRGRPKKTAAKKRPGMKAGKTGTAGRKTVVKNAKKAGGRKRTV